MLYAITDTTRYAQTVSVMDASFHTFLTHFLECGINVVLSDNAKDDGLNDSPTKMRATSEMFPQWHHKRFFVLIFCYFFIKEKVRQKQSCSASF